MKRFLLVTIAFIVLLSIAVGTYSAIKTPVSMDRGLARGLSMLDTENYLGALETLRSLPDTKSGGADAHTFLGIAYLRLHLYLAAIREFEAAEKEGARRADPWIGLASSYIELGDGQKALDEANLATRADSKSVEAWIMAGRAYWLQQNYPEAEKAALKAQQLDPAQPATAELLLHIYFDQEQPDKFETAFDRIKNPSKGVQDLAVRFYIRQGEWLKAFETRSRFDRNGIQRSILETELALRREPGKLELYPGLIRNLVVDGRYVDAINAAGKYKGPIPIDLELGKAYWMTGQNSAAIEAFQRASAGRIHKLSAEVALATLTGDIRHWREAYSAERVENDYLILSKLETSLQVAPVMIRAFIYRYAGVYDSAFYGKAAAQAQKVLDDDPKNYDALLTLATALHRLGKVPEAIRVIEQTGALYPKNAEPLARLASLSIWDKDPNRTIQLMSLAVQLEPANAGNLYNLGWMLEQVGDIPKAIALYERAIQASPISFEAMNNLALIYEQTGQTERSLELLGRAIQIDSEIEAGYLNLGNHYVRQRQWREALASYDHVLEINPGSSLAAIEKGRIRVQIGQSEAAVEDLNHALEVDAHSSDAYLLLSSAYEKMNHIKEAIAAAEEAQRIRPDDPEVKAALDRLKTQEKEAVKK